MTTYFEVKGNVKHNGDSYLKGAVVTGELNDFQGLVNDGLFEVIEGVDSLEEALQSVAENKVLEETPEEVAEESNTWGPQPDQEEIVEETPEEEKQSDEPEGEDGASTSSDEEKEEKSDEPEDDITGDEL